jgi:peptide/nickel transport system ATP-binding protein
MFEGQEIIDLSLNERGRIWGKEMSMIFQDPMTSLNPVMKIGKPDHRAAADPPRHEQGRRSGHGRSLLQDVRIPEPEKRLDQYPHEMSRRHAPARDDRDRAGVRPHAAVRRRAHHGARRHGAGADPRPAQRAAQRDRNMSIILVTHDLGVVAGHTDEIAVMYGGKLVEKAPTPRCCSRT